MPKQPEQPNVCDSGLGVRCYGFGIKNNCRATDTFVEDGETKNNGNEDKLWTPDHFSLGKNDQLYCRMDANDPNGDIICMQVLSDPTTNSETEVTSISLKIGCPSVPQSAFETGCKDDSAKYGFADFITKSGRDGSIYYKFSDNATPTISSRGTFSTNNSKGLSHASVCLGQCP